MINQTATFFEHLAKEMGLSINISRPNGMARNICRTTNNLFGIVLIGAGVFLKKPMLIALGALAVAGAALLALEE